MGLQPKSVFGPRRRPWDACDPSENTAHGKEENYRALHQKQAGLQHWVQAYELSANATLKIANADVRAQTRQHGFGTPHGRTSGSTKRFRATNSITVKKFTSSFCDRCVVMLDTSINKTLEKGTALSCSTPHHDVNSAEPSAQSHVFLHFCEGFHLWR